MSDSPNTGAGGSRRWRSGATKSIRVPVALAERVLAHARELDRAYTAPAAPAPPAALPAPARVATPLLAPPAWVRDAVFYQIFPERFCNGDKANDPPGTQRWGGKPRHFNRFGGDLAGVRKKLPYLQALGITAIYFNPLFKAGSNHKYDTADSMRIDPAFGTNAEFQALVADCHARGIRVILDGVFNHVGDRHPFFRDAVRRGPASPYWAWFDFHGYPVTKSPKPNYEAWWGYASLPKLRVKHNRAVQEYLFEVTAFWTRMGIDGWRLDVPTDIESPAFWAEWRERVRAINPEAYLVGEIWDAGLDWLHGRPFDAVTNYRFRAAVLGFFAHRNLSVDALDAQLETMRRALGPGSSEASFNLLGSHDVARFVTESGGDASRLKEALFFMMVSPGAPVIYYGDELGLAGGKDPDNRRCMPWSRVKDNAMLAFTRRLIAIRRSHPALAGGTARTLLRHNDYRLYAFWREAPNERVIVALNSGDRPRTLHLPVGHEWAVGTRVVDLVGGGSYSVAPGDLTIGALAPRTGMVLSLV